MPNDRGNPPAKLSDEELHFDDGVLSGLKLIGFAIWERRAGGGRNDPSRLNDGASHSFDRLMAPFHSQDHIRDVILQAFAEFEEHGRLTE